ncbi:MAG: DUF2130 domain-containing protein [Mycoplasmoidaceae bacterium]
MSKKIAIKIKELDKKEFFLEEDAKKGDFFCLDDVVVSTDYIKEEFNKVISNTANEIVNEKLKTEKKNWENEFKASEEYLKLKKESSNFQEKIDLLEKVYKEKEKSFHNDKANEIELIKKESSNFQEKINLLEKVYKEKEKSLHNDKVNEIELLKKDFTIERQIQENHLKSEINSLKENLEKRNNKNIKIIGEDLEKWILNEFDNHFPINDKVKLTKITKSSNSNDNTMADFEFIVLGSNKEIFGSAVIEAKTESETGKTKNITHYQKLDRQRKKMNYHYAILVSELEPEKTFLIKKISDYENMFLIRPSCLMAFLSLIEYISNQRQGIQALELDFKNKQEIQDEFEKMKNEILENSVRNINKKCEEIQSEIMKIETSSKKIKASIEIVIETHILTIKNKIENFKIESIKKKIEKIN